MNRSYEFANVAIKRMRDPDECNGTAAVAAADWIGIRKILRELFAVALREGNEAAAVESSTSPGLPQMTDGRIQCPKCDSPYKCSLASLPVTGVPSGTSLDYIEWECDNPECRHQFYAPYKR